MPFICFSLTRQNKTRKLYWISMVSFCFSPGLRPHYDGGFQTGGMWECWLCAFVWMENILRTRKLFENGDITWSSRDFPEEFSSNTNPKLTHVRCVFKILRRNVDKKHLMRFQSENAVFSLVNKDVTENPIFSCKRSPARTSLVFVL